MGNRSGRRAQQCNNPPYGEGYRHGPGYVPRGFPPGNPPPPPHYGNRYSGRLPPPQPYY